MKQPFNPLVFRGVELGVILPPRRHLEGPGDNFFFFFLVTPRDRGQSLLASAGERPEILLNERGPPTLRSQKRHDSAPAKSSFPERFHHQALSCKMSYNQNTPCLEGQKNHEHENSSVKNVLFYWDQGKKVRSLKHIYYM